MITKNIHGKVRRIIFHNKENDFTILLAYVKEYGQDVVFKGYIGKVNKHTKFICDGEWIDDPKHGRQFNIKIWKEDIPLTTKGLKEYLGSGIIKGIGKKLAEEIVDYFKEETLHILTNEPERLKDIPGFGKKKIESVKKNWSKQKNARDAMIFLNGYGVSNTFASKIYKLYGDDTMERVKSDPYRLARDINGIGFKRADEIAIELGYAKNDTRRCCGGLIFILKQMTEDGHTFAPRKLLIELTTQMLQIESDYVVTALEQLIARHQLIAENTNIYLPLYFKAECIVAERLQELLVSTEHIQAKANIDTISDITGVKYNTLQIKAIEESISNHIMVLTGGPGTGKTTTIQGIIAALDGAKFKILLAAPTGRAAKRMSEATHREAKTIHRLLKYNPQDGFIHNDENPLSGDVIILDECSMIDLLLMEHLLNAIPKNMRIIMVGDTDQLPSVGAGNVLFDIIQSKRIPVICLTDIFRQAQSSKIITNAHRINQGIYPEICNNKQSDFFFIQINDTHKITQLIIDLVNNRLPKAYNVTTHDIQVLTPMQRGEIGTTNLNHLLQSAINPQQIGLERNGYCFSKGDRVMQITNDYDREVFNGDLGYIQKVDRRDKVLTIDFDGRSVKYDGESLNNITLAYATTIHKSQGSEYPIVIIPVSMHHYVMLQRNLIYTGITRAKRLCILIGTQQALIFAIDKQYISTRRTQLLERIIGKLPCQIKKEYQKPLQQASLHHHESILLGLE